jgi:hypothetical protein
VNALGLVEQVRRSVMDALPSQQVSVPHVDDFAEA